MARKKKEVSEAQKRIIVGSYVNDGCGFKRLQKIFPQHSFSVFRWVLIEAGVQIRKVGRPLGT